MFEEVFETLKSDDIPVVSVTFVTTADSSMYMHVCVLRCV